MVSELPENGFTAKAIQTWMGDFSAERIVGKYAARMGLCFSTTREVCEVDIEEIRDIKHGRHTFTDGVGECSAELAAKAAQALGKGDSAPSAIQIRLGGCVPTQALCISY